MASVEDRVAHLINGIVDYIFDIIIALERPSAAEWRKSRFVMCNGGVEGVLYK